MDFYICRQNKTRKKVMLTSDLCWDYYLGIVPMLSNYTSINELVSVWFYFIINFIIEFVLMIFNMKFVSDGLQTVFDMKIELRINPVHLLTCYTIR